MMQLYWNVNIIHDPETIFENWVNTKKKVRDYIASTTFRRFFHKLASPRFYFEMCLEGNNSNSIYFETFCSFSCSIFRLISFLHFAFVLNRQTTSKYDREKEWRGTKMCNIWLLLDYFFVSANSLDAIGLERNWFKAKPWWTPTVK